MAGKKKPIEEIPAPSETELIERIQRIPDKETRSYAAFMYLFGNRVSEAIGAWKKERIGTYDYTHPKSGKTSKQPIYVETLGELAYEPLRKYDFEIRGNWVFINKVPTLKRRSKKHFYRTAYVNLEGYNERKFWNIVNDYLETKEKGETVWPIRRADRKLGIRPFDRRTVWKAVKDAVGIPPHKLRGMRATKDAVEYELDALDLKSKYNWASADMAFHYASLNPVNVMDKIDRSLERKKN